jgi:hypothetical protein
MTPADRLRQIADTLRTAVAEGDFDDCDAHVGTDMEALPDALDAIAKELST